MIFSKKTAVFVYLGLFIIYGFGEYLISLSKDDNKVKEKKVEEKEPEFAEFKNTTKDKNYLYLIAEKQNISEYSITSQFDIRYRDYIRYVSFRGMSGIKNVASLGVDMRFHLANYYLEGYAPFKTDKLWVPLQTLARKKTYMLDDLQYKGHTEVWQTSSEAFKYPRGDCEDHAIALADWLIEMGEDARVVLGTYKKEGHAWVVLFKDQKVYLLEATQKRHLKNPYKLAKYETNYNPKLMFNRDSFWMNTGTKYTTNYTSSDWVKESSYLRNL